MNANNKLKIGMGAKLLFVILIIILLTSLIFIGRLAWFRRSSAVMIWNSSPLGSGMVPFFLRMVAPLRRMYVPSSCRRVRSSSRE